MSDPVEVDNNIAIATTNENKDKSKPEIKTKEPQASFAELFSFADTVDRISLILGIACAIGQGLIMPLMTVVFGGIIDIFTDYAKGANTKNQFDTRIITYIVYFWYYYPN